MVKLQMKQNNEIWVHNAQIHRKQICNTTLMTRHEMSQVAEKTWPPMARRRPNRTDVDTASAQNIRPPGTCHINHKNLLKSTLVTLIYIKYIIPDLVRYRNDIVSLPKFTLYGVIAFWYRSRKFISNMLVNKVPLIQEITGLSTKYGNNRWKYAYRAITYIGLSTGTKNTSGYQWYILCASIPKNSILCVDCNQIRGQWPISVRNSH